MNNDKEERKDWDTEEDRETISNQSINKTDQMMEELKKIYNPTPKQTIVTEEIIKPKTWYETMFGTKKERERKKAQKENEGRPQRLEKIAKREENLDEQLYKNEDKKIKKFEEMYGNLNEEEEKRTVIEDEEEDIFNEAFAQEPNPSYLEKETLEDELIEDMLKHEKEDFPDELGFTNLTSKELFNRERQLNEANINSLVVSENGRMKCLITKLYQRSDNRNIELERFYKIQYQNCAILKIDLKYSERNKSGEVLYDFEVEMVFKGFNCDKGGNDQYWEDGHNVSKKTKIKKTYFGLKKEQIEKYVPFFKLKGKINLNDLSDFKSDFQNRYKTNYTIFLCNGAESIYQDSTYFQKTMSSFSWRNKFKNANLSANGKVQAKDIGLWIADYINTNNILINYYFASDLKRTQTTLKMIIESMIDGLDDEIYNSKYEKLNFEMYILPCSHDIKGRVGNCDNNMEWTVASNKAEKDETNKEFVWDFYEPYSRIKKNWNTRKS